MNLWFTGRPKDKLQAFGTDKFCMLDDKMWQEFSLLC